MFITASMISFLWASDYLRDLPKHHIENPCVPMGQKSVYEECTVQSGQLWDFSCADSLVMRSISQWSHVFGTDPKWHSRSPVNVSLWSITVCLSLHPGYAFHWVQFVVINSTVFQEEMLFIWWNVEFHHEWCIILTSWQTVHCRVLMRF